MTLSLNRVINAKVMIKKLCVLIFAGSILQASASQAVSYDDPWEGMNRAIFKFNDWLDTYALRPIARGYDAVTPKPVQQLVTNFFDNLGEVRNAANAALQLKGKEATISIGRLGINSTVGMLGLIDVATPVGLEQKYEDFGLTLAHWGTPSGPYVVLPLFGPRTLRSGLGGLPDSYLDPVNKVQPERDQWVAKGINVVNIRSSLLSSEDLIMGDRYSFIRDAYLQRRNYLITGELPEDDF